MPSNAPQVLRGGVLVVDDEEPLRQSLTRILARAGCGPLFDAANGAQALSLLQAHGEEILVVLLDLRMPQVGGMDVMQHLVNVHTIPVGVIVLTAHEELMTVEQFYSLGTGLVVASDYLVKPIEPERILREVERTTAQIQAKRAHIKASAAGELEDVIIGRLDKIEAELRRLAPRNRAFIAELGLDLLRALVIAAALLAMLMLGVGDFVRRIFFGR